MSTDYPFRAEYAKSDRSSCRCCKNKIAKAKLRLARLVQSHMHDGKDAHWFHVDCLFMKAKPGDIGEFENYDNLRWEDQKIIKDKIDSSSNVSGSSGKGKKGKGANADFGICYAKSGKSTCVACDEKIEKGEVRISKKDYNSERAARFGPLDRWHHLDCFVKIRNEPEIAYYDAGKNLLGYKDLDESHKKEVALKLPASTKRKLPDNSTAVPKKVARKESKEEELIKKQSELLFRCRDRLVKARDSNRMRKLDLARLLTFNKQKAAGGEEEMLDRVADMIVFGALKPCKTCKEGQLVYKGGLGYECQGYISEFTRCSELTDKPERVPFKMLEDLKTVEGLNVDAPQSVRERIVPKREHPGSGKGKSSSMPKLNTKPLNSFKFIISAFVGKQDGTKVLLNEIKDKILSFGGTVAVRDSSSVAAVISTRDEVKAMTKRIVFAQENKIPVVSTEFAKSLKEINFNLAEAIKYTLICDWAEDVRSRLITINSDFEKPEKGEMYETKLSSVKLRLKDGAVVDPDSNLEDCGHVLKFGKEYYSTVLNRVEIESGMNSYYKMQIIAADHEPNYWVFRSWGRIGTSIGSSTVDNMASKQAAIELFTDLFHKKTANTWGKPFMKQAGCYTKLDIDFGDKGNLKSVVPSTASSNLPLAVQEFVCLVFDVANMKKTMIEFELDMDKMPLGKISRKQVMAAYGVLNDALKYMQDKDSNSRMLLDASNRFFSLIPHSFGRNIPPILDNDVLIKSKIDMLESLLEIELAFELLQADKTEDGESSVDSHYKLLKTDIEILEEYSQEYEVLKKYLKNTHATTHSSYELDIEHVFKVNRKGENKRYRPFKALHNRKLLWHGSRTTNYAGILSQGLRIAPPEAPVTGYMFGKGIYFADMVSKSANYCCTNLSNSTGLLLLCEVALGDAHERTTAKDTLLKPPKGNHSVKGLGQTHPDPADKYLFPDGVEVPYGKPVPAKNTSSSLLYNEYIVYDVAQVNIRYLMRVNFKYNIRR